jgi:hypothetical protein
MQMNMKEGVDGRGKSQTDGFFGRARSLCLAEGAFVRWNSGASRLHVFGK